MSDKKTGEELKKELFNDKKNGWEVAKQVDRKVIFKFNDEYIDFLNKAKTERESIDEAKVILEKDGFKEISKVKTLKAGDKVYFINRDKNIFAAIIGTEKMENGLHVIGSHVDSPRLDLKPNPIYEDNGFAYFKTHYYGGIKKYQWTAIPLAIHGVIVKANGEKVKINIGESDKDPMFTITDLLPHLAVDQMQKKLKDGIEGEDLNLLIGSIPYDDDKVSEKVKLNTLKLINDKYGVKEVDFLSAEIEIVPAQKARSLGFDESMVAAYGQDDRVCAYTSLRAIMEVKNPKKTAICLLADKEEIGSVGNTGMESKAFDSFVIELLDKTGENRTNLLEKVFMNSKMLSADVDAGLDPIYSSVSEKNNSSMLGKGIGMCKYTRFKRKIWRF